MEQQTHFYVQVEGREEWLDMGTCEISIPKPMERELLGVALNKWADIAKTLEKYYGSSSTPYLFFHVALPEDMTNFKVLEGERNNKIEEKTLLISSDSD